MPNMNRQVMKAQLAQLKKDLDKKQRKLKMKAQLAQLKKDLEKKQRKLKNCESLVRARDHVRQKILEQVQLNKESDSSSEPQHRQTRVKFGGREEFEVARRIRRQSKGETVGGSDSHDTCQHATNDTCQYEISETCQYAMSDTCQHATSRTCQHATNDAMCDALDNISCIGQGEDSALLAERGDEHETRRHDVNPHEPASVVSKVTGQSQHHVDVKSEKVKDGNFGCNYSTSHVSDISPYGTNTYVRIQQNVTNSSGVDTIPVVSTNAYTAQAMDKDTEPEESCQGHTMSQNSQNSSVEIEDQDQGTSLQSQPLVVLQVKETLSSGVTSDVNSDDNISTNTSCTPRSGSSLRPRKVSKRKSKGCYSDLGIRRSTRLRSLSGSKTNCAESSESEIPKTQDSLLHADFGTAPGSALSDLSSLALESEPLSLLQSPADTIHGSKTGSTRQGHGRSRKLRKVVTSSHRYSTRHVTRCNPRTQEPFQNTSDSSTPQTRCVSPAMSLLPNIEHVLSSPELSDVVYFSLPDVEFGGLKLQKAKQNTLCKTTTKVESGQPCRMHTRNSQVVLDKYSAHVEMDQAADVKSEIRFEQQNISGLIDPTLGTKSHGNQSIIGDVYGTTMLDEGLLPQGSKSPIVFHSLKEVSYHRSLRPQTSSRSQDSCATRKINIRRNISSKGKELRKMHIHSLVQTKVEPSEEDVSQSVTVDGQASDEKILTHSNNTILQDSTKHQHSDPLTSQPSDTFCKEVQVCESANNIVLEQTAKAADNHEYITDTISQAVLCGDMASTQVIDPVCDGQHKTEIPLLCGSCPFPLQREAMTSKGVEVDGTSTNVANDIVDRSCALPIDVADLETKVTELASSAASKLFSDNCPLTLIHSVGVDTEEDVVCLDVRSERKGNVIAYCTHSHVVLCRHSTDKTCRQMTLGHSSCGSTYQRVHLLTNKKAIAVVAVLMSSCGVIHGELYKVIGRQDVTVHHLEFANKLPDQSPPGAILSCVLADLDLCLTTSTKVTTSLVKVTLATQLDGDFTETQLEAVSDVLVSLCPVENLHGAVVGLSHTTVHVWNYMSGSLLVSAVLPLEIDSCPVVCSEDGLLFCTVVCYDSVGLCLVAVNPETLQAALINRAITPTPLQQHKILTAAANSKAVCTLSANNLVALWSVYSATCLGYRPAVDATRVCFSDASKTLMLASRHTVDIYSL